MIYSHYHSSNLSNNDFNVVQYGKRECVPKFCVYHKSCENYLFHYVYSGKGTFCVKNPLNGNVKEYTLSANQAFIIYPGQEVWYTSDKSDPFFYRWIEFFGDKAIDFLRTANLTLENPIHTATEPYDCGRILTEITESGVLSPMRLTGLFWMMADSLAKDNTRISDNVSVIFNDALKYIHANVHNHTTVEEVASNVGVSRGYLSKIFSRFINQSPKQYIITYHINEAKSLLLGTAMTVSEIGFAVGFENISDFTRTFKRITGLTPSDFKNIHTQKDNG
ncbi:MAG: AraC family transcriptional regulator [Clostridia bacterium]|nr:AraC family transcriptional regulator [Clostridia bacterium]